MPNRFASGKKAIAECDVCGQRYKLKQLRPLVIKTKNVNVLACPECWNPDHPQLQLGMYPVDDPQALRNPRPDNSYAQSGLGPDGNPNEGSRVIQWGWNPVGLNNPLGLGGLRNDLLLSAQIGNVVVVTPTWILADGFWDDDLFWDDEDFWNDGTTWILTTGFWGDTSVWDDQSFWKDGPS